jgi:hypothetical protein
MRSFWVICSALYALYYTCSTFVASFLLLLLLQTLAAAYPNLDVVMLWGNMNATTKELFRDQLLVSSQGTITKRVPMLRSIC